MQAMQTQNKKAPGGKRKPLPPIPAKRNGPNKKKNKTKKAARVYVNPAAVARTERFYLSPCSKTYLQALCDPFSLNAGMACVPDLRDIASQKLMVKARGTFQTGTLGFGYCVVSPFASVSDANYAIISTSALYAGANVRVNTATAGVIGSDAATFPYTFAQTPNIKQRTVACGVRVRYLGTELNRSGRMVAIRLPLGSTLSAYTTQDCLTNNSIQSVPVSRKWTYITFVPTADADYEYFANSGGAIDATDSLKQARLGIIVDGTVASNAFEWEAVWHKEYYSENQNLQAIPNLSASHSDVSGLSAIRNYFEGTVDYLGGPESFRNAINFVTKYSPVEVSHLTTLGSMAYAGARAAGYV